MFLVLILFLLVVGLWTSPFAIAAILLGLQLSWKAARKTPGATYLAPGLWGLALIVPVVATAYWGSLQAAGETFGLGFLFFLALYGAGKVIIVPPTSRPWARCAWGVAVLVICAQTFLLYAPANDHLTFEELRSPSGEPIAVVHASLLTPISVMRVLVLEEGPLVNSSTEHLVYPGVRIELPLGPPKGTPACEDSDASSGCTPKVSSYKLHVSLLRQMTVHFGFDLGSYSTRRGHIAGYTSPEFVSRHAE